MFGTEPWKACQFITQDRGKTTKLDDAGCGRPGWGVEANGFGGHQPQARHSA